MREFFHGFRRKAGCVTLVMALALMAAWMRSITTRDLYARMFTEEEGDRFRSFQGGIGWQWGLLHSNVSGWSSDANFTGMMFDPWWTLDSFLDDDIKWQWEWAGFEFSSAMRHEFDIETRIIPYWSLVLPLTLLSAYLILWPGKRKAAQPTQNSTTPTSDLHS